jgi:REP element-mobilizing transposase RayT
LSVTNPFALKGHNPHLAFPSFGLGNHCADIRRQPPCPFPQPKGPIPVSPGQRLMGTQKSSRPEKAKLAGYSPINHKIAMPQSLSKVLVHLIFSTKQRRPLIRAEIHSDLCGYITGILKNLHSPSLQTGGTADHLHILLSLSRTISLAKLVEEVKKSSSKWMKQEGGVPEFSWQAGYGAFSVGESQAETVIRYIRNQEEHHRKMTFQEEFRRFLARYRVSYDEHYVWD